MTADVPTGPYCYGYVLKENAPFDSVDAVYSHLDKKYGDTQSEEKYREKETFTETKYCKYWNPTEHGFVECLHTKIKALWISGKAEDYEAAIAYFGSKEKADSELNGFLLGDRVKECRLNEDGDWGRFPPEGLDISERSSEVS